MRVTTFVFYDIPASFASFLHRPFVFIDIPASFPQFRNMLCLAPTGWTYYPILEAEDAVYENIAMVWLL